MASVYLLTPGSRAKLTSERLDITLDKTNVIAESYPIEEIDQLVVHAGVHLSTQAISKILRLANLIKTEIR